MSRIGVLVKLLSFLHVFFGNVRVGIVRCVAVTAIAVTSLFAFDIKPADAYLNGHGIRFVVNTPSDDKAVAMVFNFTGHLVIETSGNCVRNGEDVYYGDTVNFTVNASTALRTVTCTFPDSGENFIQLRASNITAYPTYTGTNAPSNTYSVFRFSTGAAYITGIHASAPNLGDVFYTLGNSDGQQPRFIGTFSGCTSLVLNASNDGSSNVVLFAGSGDHSNGIYGTAASWMFANMFYGCTSLNKIPFKKTGAAGIGFFRNLTVAPTSYGVFYQTFRGCTALTNIETVSVGSTTYPIAMFDNMGITVAQKMFQGMFYGCINVTTVPSGFFSHFSSANTDATYLFYQTFYGCTGLTTITGAFTSVNGGKPTQYMFYSTFQGCAGLQSLPDNLFSPFTGTPASYMFHSTFRGCTGLRSLNKNIFNNMGTASGATRSPASYMFYYMFYGCNNQYLTTIPSGFFSQFSISNSSATYLFAYTFGGCTNLTTITGVFTSVNGGIATEKMFFGTFQGCTSLTSLPNDLFSSFTGAPANYMFQSTFAGCTNLENIDGVFTGVGSNVTATNRVLSMYMFNATFSGCTKIKPGKYLIFSPFNGWTAAQGAFAQTFMNCKGEITLTADLFKNIVGKPEADLFYKTFLGCTGLFGALPKDLFAGLRGSDSSETGCFSEMFSGCTSLGKNSVGGTVTYFIPPEFFYGISSRNGHNAGYPITPSGSGKVTSIFSNTGLLTECPLGYSEYNSVDPYNSWYSSFSSKVVCEPTMPTTKFSMTLTALSAGDSFAFYIIAKGDFYVRWGDGAPVEKISAANLTAKYFNHTYINAASAGTITVELSSENVTGYTTNIKRSNSTSASLNFPATIAGATPIQSRVRSLSGSLGQLFPTINTGAADGEQPLFNGTFASATNLQSIPDTLFSGLTGDISTSGPYMFYQMFNNCTALSGSLPQGLFAGLTGTIPTYMFAYMFYNCSSLTGYIPPLMFKNFTKWATESYQMQYMFYRSGIATSCGGFTNAPDPFYTGYEGSAPNSLGGKVSCFNGLTINTSSISDFSFNIYAAGNFYVGWGDSKINEYTRASASTTATTPSHTYSSAGNQKIQIGGAATGYYNSSSVAAISFKNKTSITGLSGSLGYVFSGSPRFYQTFSGCTGLTSLPSTLFNGLTTASTYMFYYTFSGCTGLTSLPVSLFGGLTNTADYMFRYTFNGCNGLTNLNKNIFGTTAITSNMANYLFQYMFNNCLNLTTVMNGFFSRFKGKPGNGMFYGTFNGCAALTTIGTGDYNHIFTGVGSSVTVNSNQVLGQYMFRDTFYGCTALAPGAITIFTPFNNWHTAVGAFYRTFYLCKGQSYFQNNELFGNMLGTPDNYLFYQTFYGCEGLYEALPNGFINMDSLPVGNQTFYQMFYGCKNLGKDAINGTSTYYIPPDFFAGVTPNANATNPTYQMFTGTGLLTECPGLLNQYFTGFEVFADGSNSPKVSCKRCAYLPGQASYGNTCYDLCNLNGDNMTKLHVGDNWFYLFAQSEATNFTHHLNFKYGNNATDICFVPLDDSGWGAANSGSLNFNTGTVKYHAKRSGTTSRSGGEQSKTKSVAVEPEQKTKQ